MNDPPHPGRNSFVTEDIRAKVDALTISVNALQMKYALTEQHLLNHEKNVSDFMLRNDEQMEIVDKKIETGFNELRKSNADQTRILNKWSTVRDTLLWVGSVIAIGVTAIWAVFTWATGHFSK